MNKKILGLILPLIFSVASLSGCDNSKVPSKDQYYSGIDFENYSGMYLAEQLNELMWRTHVYEVPYDDYQTYEVDTKQSYAIDKIPGEECIQSFYSGKKASWKSGTREHVWPCANSENLWSHGHIDSSTDYFGGGSDLYHVRPCNSYMNTARGNSKFVDFDDFPGAYGENDIIEVKYDGSANKGLKIFGADLNGTTHYQYAKLCEVDDSFKGDVARILAYVYLHYYRFSTTPADKADYVGLLSFQQVLGYKEDKCYKKLIEWNKLDKPSDVEKLRNDTVQKIQGNRNPFVDYPDLMETIFGDFIEEEE